jgi:hypothetical protein
MLRLRPLLLLPAFLVGTAIGCMNDDDVVDCDSATEVRVTYGSDTTEDEPTVVCEPSPNECTGNISCDCLPGHRFESGVAADFCLESGSCEDDGDTIEVVCPGG